VREMSIGIVPSFDTMPDLGSRRPIPRRAHPAVAGAC
jgi:hypothetical protein